MEIDKLQELRMLAAKQIETANEYAKQRRIAGEAKCDSDLLLASELSNIRFEKPNVGYEMAHLMLQESNETARKLYKEWQVAEAKYKGLEKIIDSQASAIMLEQSIMKREAEGEKYGA